MTCCKDDNYPVFILAKSYKMLKNDELFLTNPIFTAD